MVASPYERSALALAALRHFPSSVLESVISDPAFRNSYGFTADGQLSFGNSGVSVQRSKLFNGIREILADTNARPIIKDVGGGEWRLELINKDKKLLIALSDGARRIFLPDCSALSPDRAIRLNGFVREADDVNLPTQVLTKWCENLSCGVLSDEEMESLYAETTETPIRVAELIRSEMESGGSKISTLVPRSEQYFNRLVGECQQSRTIEEYAHAEAQDHIHQLMSWRAYDGFLLALLLSSHSLNSFLIKIDQVNEENLIRAYQWLQTDGDMISKLGAIEIGLSILDRQPKIEPFIKGMISQIRDDNVDGERSRFQLLSALIILVEGELSRTKTLREKPPFWRRLASIAQASLIEREISGLVDITKFCEWAIQVQGQYFYFQTLSDLRREPRWHPEFVSSHQLKAEFVGRIVGAAQLNTSKIEILPLRELLLDEGPECLHFLVKFPFSYLPGPLEGGIESQNELPIDIVRKIEDQLSDDDLRPDSFAALVNSALLFHLSSHQAQLAAKALRIGKHQLKQAGKEHIFSVLNGLATVAAVTRSTELAAELKILMRRCWHQPGQYLSTEAALQTGLIAAAAHSDLMSWCDFVGEWITELAFQPSSLDEMRRLNSSVELLFHIVPELWCTCGRAQAALHSVVDMHSQAHLADVYS